MVKKCFFLKTQKSGGQKLKTRINRTHVLNQGSFIGSSSFNQAAFFC